jgi:16S rRNA G966 N2-methylase RsmD
LFPYFGRKGRSARLYPCPRFPLVIEPFAGSLSYTLHHRPNSAIGIEQDDRVVALWHRMLEVTGMELPPAVGSKTNDLLVKVASYSEHALTSGEMTVTSRMIRDWTVIHQRAALAAPWARSHVQYFAGTYANAPDVEATWFIDPPYQRANRRGYLFGADKIDYDHLAAWVMSRKGQVIVCEQDGADWLPFTRLADFATHRGAISREVIWTSDMAIAHRNNMENRLADSTFAAADVSG